MPLLPNPDCEARTQTGQIFVSRGCPKRHLWLMHAATQELRLYCDHCGLSIQARVDSISIST